MTREGEQPSEREPKKKIRFKFFLLGQKETWILSFSFIFSV